MGSGRAVILSAGPQLTIPLEHLTRPSTPVPADDGASMFELLRRSHVVRVLEETNWVIGGPHAACDRSATQRAAGMAANKLFSPPAILGCPKMASRKNR